MLPYFLGFILGIFGGGIAVYALLHHRTSAVAKEKAEQDARHKQLDRALKKIERREAELEQASAQLQAEVHTFESKCISYEELTSENGTLKHDLQNIDVELRKLKMDRAQQKQSQEVLDQKGKDLGSRYLTENIKWIGTSLNANNFAACKKRLLKVIERCREIGFEVPKKEETGYVEDLKREFEKAVRAAFEREEQARIKAQIREEQKLQKEVERELQKLEREREAIQAALEKAMKDDAYSAEVDSLKARLAEAEARSQRAISQAQLTRSGYVYVISNIGSFGEGVFKIGMTRRLEPQVRVKELSSASVPFPFDVHMMISSDDAPTLENELHRAFHKLRLNKTNPRKEFFRTGIDQIQRVVEGKHGNVEYVADAEALEYRQSLDMTDDDLEFIEHVYEDVSEGDEALADID